MKNCEISVPKAAITSIRQHKATISVQRKRRLEFESPKEDENEQEGLALSGSNFYPRLILGPAGQPDRYSGTHNKLRVPQPHVYTWFRLFPSGPWEIAC